MEGHAFLVVWGQSDYLMEAEKKLSNKNIYQKGRRFYN